MRNEQSALDLAKQLTIADLKPADVLMARGHGFISELIMKADGGQYSHGAIWSGVGVIQATSKGITHAPDEGEFDVYRHRDLDDAGAKEVVDFAKTQVSGTYAYGELVMLGLLFSCGLRVKGALLNRVLEAIGGAQAASLQAWLQSHSEQKIRVCTELVATCFYHTTKNRFALKVLPFRDRPAATPAAQAELQPAAASDTAGTRGGASAVATPFQQELVDGSANCLDILMRGGLAMPTNVRGTSLSLPPLTPEAATNTRKVFTDPIAFDAVSAGKLGVVTPADLQFSPSLQFIGHFKAG